MNSQREDYYSLAPGIDIVPLGDGNILFRSDTLSIRIEGQFSGVLVERVVPLLDGQHTLAEIAARLPDISIDNLRHNLDALVQAQILRHADHLQEPQSFEAQAIAPFLAMLDSIGISAPEALQRLRQLCVAIVGLEGHGAYAASILAQCGIGKIVLIDPYPCQLGNLALMPLVGLNAVGTPRQQALQAALQAQGGGTELQTGSEREITRESISALAPNCHILVSCFDKGFSSTHHWINRASLEHRVPAIYAESRGHTALVGPLVLPGQTACYMCYRMRSVACEEDFNAAMSYEEFLDRQKRPALHERGTLPTMPPYVASLLTLDILKCLLSLSQPPLAGKVLEVDALSLRVDIHAVLQKPDCPVCQLKKKWDRPHPLLSELRQSDDPPGNLLAVAPQLLSRRTGIIRDFQQVQKDVSEPARPYIFRAEIANHRFLGKEDSQHRMCSGKGMTSDDAQTSALGEAVERYSGACWDHGEILYVRRDKLDGETLDPHQLVLYAPRQYEQLRYTPYTDKNIMGWVRARSLVTGKDVFVPALAVFMSYEVRLPQEFICPITSNGLAAGSTLLDALLGGAFEVIERDTFMITWLNRLPCKRVDPWSHPDPDITDLCEAYRRRNVEIKLYSLPRDHPCHVFAALGVQGEGIDGPAVVVGLGADLEPSRAAQRAILEVAQVRPALRRRLRHPATLRRMEELVANPHLVTGLEDHDLLYASWESRRAFDFLLERPLESIGWEPQSSWRAADKLQVLVDHFQAEGWDLIYYNLTPPDMRTLGLYTARVIIPGFQPIDFGWKERRLGGNRLYELPYRLGIAATTTTPEQLNNDPHPIS
jgi:ribosomal protein S12 methylthiotransferase accessory factor